MGLVFVCGEEEQKVARTTRPEKEGAQASGQDRDRGLHTPQRQEGGTWKDARTGHTWE